MSTEGIKNLIAHSAKDASVFKEVPLVTPEMEYERLVAKIKEYLPHDTLVVVEAAYKFAAKYHGEQKRRSGEMYVTHPLAVANILTDLRVDPASIVAAILHDTVEDTTATLEDIKNDFGSEVSELVDGLTKISKIKFRSNQERQAENFRKMILAMGKDLRVILIKLADRLHNMRTISHMPSEKCKRIAQETLDIYAPLANRLGIYGIKSELEDLCLRQLKNEIYKDIRGKVSAKKTQRQTYIEEVKTILENELKKYNFQNVKVYGRPKHFYSIYKKMQERRLEFEDIHDLFAFRIIVESIKDCYEALGIVHAMWKPMPGRFKDYIAMPKANMYQSLHTTVIRPNGEPAEIQIRTAEMHRVCEYGVAAHWSYKETRDAKKGTISDLEKFSWLRQIVQWQNELKDPEEFIEAVKVDLFDEEIFVFTPKGDVISLPQKSTALDFAFAVHTSVGLHTIGAKVNSRIAPIKKVLKSGDIVEILTSPHQKPSKDWLNFVITSKAKSRIRSSLRSVERERGKDLGKELLGQALESCGMTFGELQEKNLFDTIIKHAHENNFDDALIAIGYGKINAGELIAKSFPQKISKTSLEEQAKKGSITGKEHAFPKTAKKAKGGILVSGLDNVMVNFGKCCSPLPGEEVVGFITRGKGVTIHRARCSKALDLDPARRIEVTWASEANQSFHTAYLRVLTRDRHGVLAEVTSAISHCGANIQKAEVNIGKDLLGVLDFELALQSLSQMESVIKRVESVPSVVNVERRNIFKNKKKGS